MCVDFCKGVRKSPP